MATQDDKPQTTPVTEREKEDKEFLTEVTGIPVTKLPLAEMKQVEPLHDDIQVSYESKNGEMNTEPDSSNLNKDENGGSVHDSSSLDSIDATSVHNAELYNVGREAYFEDCGTVTKLITTTASFEGDPHETSFPAKEAKSSEISSTPEDTMLDPEILHSSVSVVDEITEKDDNSDLSKSTSTQTACQSDHLEERKENAQTAEIQPASHVITLTTTDPSAGTAGPGNRNYEVKSTDDATDDSNDDVGISSHSEYPNKEDDKKAKENGDSNKEQLSSPLVAESTEETISQNMDLDKVDQLEGNSGTINEGGQERSKLSLDMKERIRNELEILGADNLESSISESQNSSCDKPESIREVSDIVLTSKESQPKEIHRDDTEEMMQQKEEVSSEEHKFTSQGSQNMESKSGEDLQVKNTISMSPKDEADYKNDQEIRGSENIATDLEEDQSNRRTTESAKEGGSRQQFQIIVKANKAVDEANNPELLPIKDLSTVASDEIPEAVIREAAKDVIWEQKEVPITKESEEVTKRNDELADATNLLSQSSDENSKNYQAIQEADDCTDNTNISRMPAEEEKGLKEVHVDDKSLATSDIVSQEKPLGNNSRSNTGLSSEEVGDVKLENNLGLALQLQTTESEHADKDHISIENSSLTENEAAENARTDEEYRSQDQCVKKLLESGDNQTVKCDGENKIEEDSCKGITTAVPKSESNDAVIETKVGSDQNSSAAKVVDIVEVIPSMMLRKGEEYETSNILENKKDETTNTNEDIVNETSNASFATNFDKELLQKDENESPSIKEIQEENDGMEASEAEGKEHVSEVDDPATIASEHRMELPVEKETEDEKSLNSDDTRKNGEQSGISQSLGKGNQPNKEDQQYEEATELFMRPDEVLQSKVDIENSQVFAKANETEINKENLKGATTEIGDTILIEKSNEIQEILLNDQSVEKIGNKHRGTEDSSCCSPPEEINQKSDQEDDLKLEADPGAKADGIFVATNNTSSNTKFEEPKTTDATESFKKEMPTEEKFGEGPSQVSEADETVKYSITEEGKEKRNVNDSTNYDEFKQEVDPEVKADETTNTASQSTKTEEPETIYTTQSFQKQDEEQVVEGSYQTAEEILPYNHRQEETKERNVISTKKKDEFKAEIDKGITADEISESINDASNSTKFEEAETIEATQSFNNNKVGEGCWQIAEQTENHSPEEEGKEERNVKEKTASDELKPEMHTGEKFEEPEALEATQRLNTPMPSEDPVVEGPFQGSIAEDVINYSTVEEGKEERNDIHTTGDDIKPESDPEVKVDEISATTSNASQSIKFEGTEIFDATQSFKEQSPTEGKGVEEPCQVSTAEEIVNYIPVEEAKEERNVKDTAIQEELNPELAPGTKPHEISETINNASFQDPEPIEAIQSVNKQIPSEENVIELPDQVSAEEEIVNYIPVAEAKEERNVMDTAIQEELNPELAPGTKPHEISDTINNARFQEPEPIDAIQSVKKQIASEEKVIEQPDQVSAEEEIVNYIPVAEAKEERNVKDKAIQEELNPELAPGTKPHEISETINNASFQEPSPIDAIQSVNKQIASEEKVIEQPGQVSAIEEIVNYHESAAEEIENYHLAENELKDAKDTITVDELQPKVDPGGTVDEISDTTHYASESTKFEDPKTVDATQSFTKWTTREGQVGEGPPHVSTADDAVNYSPVEEEKEEGNVKDATHSYELNPDVDQGENVKEESETIEIASESAKFEEPHCIDVSRSFQKDIPSEDEAVEGPHRVSTEEKIVNYSLAEEGKAESNTKQTITRDELKSEVDPKVELEVPEIIEATLGINTQMPSEDKVVEGTPQASIAVDVGNYRPAEERKEDRNVNNTTADELPTRIELEETNSTNVTQSFEKEIPRKGKIVEGPCQVSAEEEPVNDNSAEEGEERNVIDAATQDELKPEVAPGIKLDEISENMKNANESAKLQQPESLDATQSISKQINSDDKVVAGSHHIVTAEEIVNYHLADEGEAKDVKDTTLVDEYHELKAKIESEVMADEISETHYASESTKQSTEPGTVEATTSFQEEMPKEDKVVEGPPKVSTAEEIVNYSPAEEEKEERNVKDPTISDVLKPEEDPEEISPFIDNASQITKLEGCETAEVSLSFNKEMQSEDDVVEGPPQVSTPEEISYEEEGKAERNVKETTARGELKTEADQKIEGDETSETTNSTSKTPEFELPENIEATKGVHTQILSEDKIDEGPIQVSIAEDVGTCNLEEERNDKNVDHETRDVSPTRIKLEGSSVTDATQGFEKEIPRKDKVVEQLFQVSTAEELVTDSPAEEGKEERNLTDAASQDESGKRLYEMSKTMKNFQVPEPIDDTQSVKEQVASEEKVIEGPHHVSTVEETVIYHLADEGEEKNVKDTTTTDELNLKVESGIRADEISETHYASESTKFKEAESVDATTSFQEQMLKEGKVVEGPPRVSTAEEIVNYSPAGEEKEERNVKDTTISNDLKPEVDPGAKLNEISETKDNSSESANFKEPERIDVTKSFNKEVQIEDEVVDGHPQVSTAEEIVNHSCAEEGKAERNFNETATRDELNTEVNPKVEVDEIYKTTKSASETKKFEAPETIEAIQGISTPSEDKVVEEPFQVPIAEDVGNYRREEEREEDRNDKNTIADLPTGIKLEETDQTDVTQCSEKQISSNDQAVEGPCQVSIAEELVNLSPSEEGQQERSVMEASTQDELKQEVAPEIKPDEILETLKNANESTQFQEPETIGATQSSNTQMTYEDRNVEGPHQVSTAEGIDNYSLAQGEEWNVKDTRALDELKAEVNPEAPGDAISEPTYYASRSTKFEEPDTVDANQSFKKQISGESRVVEEPPQDPNAEEMLDSIPAEERKEELNIKDTTLNDDLKPEVNPGLKVDIINSTSQSTKLEDDETMHVAKNCNKQMQSEDKVVEWPPQISTAEEIQNHSPAEEGKEESSVKDISAREDLEVHPIVKADEISGTTNNATETTKFEEPETIDAIQSSKKQIPSEVNVVGGSCDVSTTKEIMHYNSGEGEETNVKDTTTAVELKTKEDTRGKADEISASSNKFDETETIDATQSFKKQMPSEDKVVEGNHQSSTMVEIVNSSAAEEEKEERNVKDTTTKLELQEKTDKLPNTNTETEITTPNEKVEVPEVGFPKYDEGPKGCNDQEKIFRNDLEETARESSEKLGEYIVSEAETLKPVHAKIEDYPISKDVAKEDTNTLESHKDDEQTQYSPSESLYEITNVTGLGLEKQEGGVDKDVTLLLSGTSGYEESNKLDNEEHYPSQANSFTDEEKEEKVEEQENLSTSTGVIKLDGDEFLSKRSEKEEKKFQNQNQKSDFPFAGEESEREIQGEIKELHHGTDPNVVASEVQGESGGKRKTSDECEETSSSIKSDLISEVKVRGRSTEEILIKAEHREDKDQDDTSMKEISQKDELADLMQATNNSANSDMSCKSSIAMSDLEITAKEGPETGIESKLLSEDKEFSVVQNGPSGETLHPEIELKPGDASQAVAEAVKAEYGEREQLNDDCNEQTENFRSAISEENSPSELEQSRQETPREQGDGETQDQQRNITYSTLEIARNKGPMDDAAIKMDTNLPLDMQKLEVAPSCEFHKQVEEADPNDSSIDTQDLPEVQQKATAESSCAGGENQKPVECSEDKETEEATGKSILEEKSMTSLPKVHTSSIDTKDLPEVQQKATAEASCAEGENQEPVECSEDKETEEATGKSILEEKSMNSLPEVHISSVDTQDLPEVQQKETAETSCAEGENQEPVECSEDKETEEVTGKSILEEKSMTSLPKVHISSIDTKDLPEVKETAETSCAEGENQEPVECSEDKGDKETEEAPGKSILEEKSMNSPPEVHISSIDTKDLPEIQQKETAETSCAEGENQAPVECSEDKEDKETEEATGKSIVEDKSMNSRPEVHISSIDTQDLPGVQRQATAETSCAEGENQEPVECGEDTEEATGKSILEEKSMTSPPEVHISSIDTKDLPEVQQKATAETSCPEGECSEDKETEEAKGKSILEDKSMTSLPEVHISSINTKDLPKVQQKVTAESSCTDRENREPVECNEDKETEDATGKSLLEEKSMTSLPELLDTSQVSADFNSESKQTIQREETKDGKTGISEPEEPNTDEDKDEEGEGDKQLRSESAYDHPVIVEASRDIHVKASPKKSHNILSGVGSKVKHSIAKVKKVITGKSSHPKPSSPK